VTRLAALAFALTFGRMAFGSSLVPAPSPLPIRVEKI